MIFQGSSTSGNEYNVDQKFKDLMFNAQTYANQVQREVPIKWRSYKTVMKPNQPILTDQDLERALKKAKAYQEQITSGDKVHLLN